MLILAKNHPTTGRDWCLMSIKYRGFQTRSWRVHCPAEFSSSLPQHTCVKFLVCLLRPWFVASGVFDWGWSWTLQDIGPSGLELPIPDLSTSSTKAFPITLVTNNGSFRTLDSVFNVCVWHNLLCSQTKGSYDFTLEAYESYNEYSKSESKATLSKTSVSFGIAIPQVFEFSFNYNDHKYKKSVKKMRTFSGTVSCFSVTKVKLHLNYIIYICEMTTDEIRKWPLLWRTKIKLDFYIF